MLEAYILYFTTSYPHQTVYLWSGFAVLVYKAFRAGQPKRKLETKGWDGCGKAGVGLRDNLLEAHLRVT